MKDDEGGRRGLLKSISRSTKALFSDEKKKKTGGEREVHFRCGWISRPPV